MTVLTSAQKATLKTAVQADGTANTLYVDGNVAGLADYLNQKASPDFWVWRPFVPDAEIYEATVETLSWSWTIYIGRSQGERDAWRQMVNMRGGLNASLANVRTGIADIFSGAGGSNQRAFLLTLGRRVASRVEKVLGSGTGSTVSPATLTFEGPLSTSDLIGL